MVLNKKKQFVITDQGREYHYSVRIYEDNQGAAQVEITQQKENK